MAPCRHQSQELPSAPLYRSGQRCLHCISQERLNASKLAAFPRSLVNALTWKSECCKVTGSLWLEGTFWDHLAQTPWAQAASARAGCPGLSSWVFSASTDRDSTTSLSNLLLHTQLDCVTSSALSHLTDARSRNVTRGVGARGITGPRGTCSQSSSTAQREKHHLPAWWSKGIPALLTTLHRWNLVACLLLGFFSFWIILFKEKQNAHQWKTKKQMQILKSQV